MTQILTVLSGQGCLHVSDRLLSLPDGRPADVRSNKSLVVRTKDADVLVGYSGTAMVNGSPTDDWLAGCLVSEPAQGWFLPSGRNDVGILQAGQLVQRLQQWLEIAAREPRQVRHGQFELIVQLAGYREDPGDGGYHRFGFELHLPRGAVVVRRTFRRDRWRSRKGLLTVATPRLTDDQYEEMSRDLTARGQGSFEDFRAVIIDGMKRIVRPGVGLQYLSVGLFPGGGRPWVTLRFYPGDEGVDYFDEGLARTPTTYTPWFVTPVGAIAPMVTNCQEVGVEGTPFNVRIEGLPPISGLPFTGAAQPQKRRPTLDENGIGIDPGWRFRNGVPEMSRKDQKAEPQEP